MKRSVFLLSVCLAGHVCMAQTTIKVNVENEAVQRFLDEVSYTKESASQISQYINLSQPGDIPNPAIIEVPETDADSLLLRYSETLDFTDTIWVLKGDKAREEGVRIYNLVPDRTYYYQLLVHGSDSIVSEGTIETSGRVRMINANSIRNVRDLGGWETVDGKRVRYEKLYRGRELNGQYVADSADVELLKHLGIRAEIDMRHNGEDDGAGISAFGFLSSNDTMNNDSVSYLFTDNSGCCDLSHLTNYYWQMRYRKEFKFIVENLRLGRPIYFHCVNGADRAGLLSMFIEGVLGVPYEGLMKDYELTSFWLTRRKDYCEFVFDYIESLNGNTLKDKFRNYLVNNVMINQSDINFLRSELLEDKLVDVGIREMQDTSVKKSQSEGMYDLQGRRMNDTRHSGVYIHVDRKGVSSKVVRE